MRTRPLLTLALAACQPTPANPGGFASSPELTTTAPSTDTASSSSAGSSTTGTGDDESESVADSEPARDLGGSPDFGDGSPVGCKGKIDLLFVISRQANMRFNQAQLIAAFPKFIDTIESKFADFDYHIMVVKSDDWWGNQVCTDLCPIVDCKAGDPCCDLNYPCQDMNLLSGCDSMWGAGVVFPAGVDGEANAPCPVDGGRRYLVKGQTNLKDTFECIATVGNSGWGALAQGMVAAMQAPINAVGGCNKGFLRDDALLMVTFIANTPDSEGWDSNGTPAAWAQAVLDAKHGDPESIVMFSIFHTEIDWDPYDRIGQLVTMFPYNHRERHDVADYGPAFATAAGLVKKACAGFKPPG